MASSRRRVGPDLCTALLVVVLAVLLTVLGRQTLVALLSSVFG